MVPTAAPTSGSWTAKAGIGPASPAGCADSLRPQYQTDANPPEIGHNGAGAMQNMTALPQTDPSLLYRTRDEIYAADMLIAALKDLDLFTWIGEGTATIDDIADHFGFHRRPVDVMTTLFVAMGLMERED